MKVNEISAGICALRRPEQALGSHYEVYKKKDLTKQQKCAIVLYIDSTETTSTRLCLKKNIH
jgi:hypothetical protein